MPRASVREQIVDAAFEQFHRHGYNACGVKLITDSAGVPKGSFYNHFESKEALALEVMNRFGETRHLGELSSTKSPLAGLHNHFKALAKDIVDYGYERGCMYGNFSNEAADHIPSIREGLTVALGFWTDAVTSTIRDAQALGEITSPQSPEVLARFLTNAWEGAIIGERAAKDGSSFQAFFTIAFEVILR